MSMAFACDESRVARAGIRFPVFAGWYSCSRRGARTGRARRRALSRQHCLTRGDGRRGDRAAYGRARSRELSFRRAADAHTRLRCRRASRCPSLDGPLHGRERARRARRARLPADAPVTILPNGIDARFWRVDDRTPAANLPSARVGERHAAERQKASVRTHRRRAASAGWFADRSFLTPAHHRRRTARGPARGRRAPRRIESRHPIARLSYARGDSPDLRRM